MQPPHVDLQKYLERKTMARDALSRLKEKMRSEASSPFSRDPEFGSARQAVTKDHHYLKTTPRSNILQHARLLQTRVDQQYEELTAGKRLKAEVK